MTITRTVMGISALVVAMLAFASGLKAHPHPGDVVTDTIRGRVTEIDLDRGTIAVDAIDRQTKRLRNYLFFLDPKVKVTRAKKKVAVGELMPGQAVVCVVEIELNERNEETRYIVFDIRFDEQARPANY